MDIQAVVSSNDAFGRHWLAALGESAGRCHVGSLAEALRLPLSPAGLLVIDLRDDAAQLTERLPELVRRTRLILGGLDFAGEEELQWLGRGVLACCGPGLRPEERQRIVAVVRQGGFWLSARAWPLFMLHLHKLPAAAPPDRAGNPALARLTSREREVATLVADGSNNKQIARALNITDRTVKTHLTAVFSKLGVADRLHLALLLKQSGSDERRGDAAPSST
ncbi:helix-turn-helix transcriptional regulator [Chitinilyticum litopenaei]|uniref:helix-turn-helix transcriptional regulator n=1 Tax=Chitinilyticum litopenaei TaxID=1121276 RepID=UPI0003FBCDF3|nr:response regulator transcription factor [Chitinilyticum litopenaei]